MLTISFCRILLPISCTTLPRSCWLLSPYVCNFTRIGSLVMVIHDISDIFLEVNMKILQLIAPWVHSTWSVVAERSSALDSSSDVVRMWVQIPAWPVAALVSLSKTLNHNCFVLRMGRKAVGPVCCVMHVKETRTLIVIEKGLASVFLDLRLEHPEGWICTRYKSSVLLLLLVQISM